MLAQIILIKVFLLSASLHAVTTLFGPSQYFSEKDSPFYGGIIDNTGDRIWLEDFEDQELNTPNVISPDNLPEFGSTYRERFSNISNGIVWSVDGDDGSVDFTANFSGDTWISIDKATNGPSNFMEFEFLPDEEGRLPRYVGFVVTRTFNIFRDVEVNWRDADGDNLFSDGEFDALTWEPPGGAGLGDPRSMRFIGLFHDEGIARLQLSNVLQLDHLQYGYAIPEPSTGLLTLTASSFLLGIRRR